MRVNLGTSWQHDHAAKRAWTQAGAATTTWLYAPAAKPHNAIARPRHIESVPNRDDRHRRAQTTRKALSPEGRCEHDARRCVLRLGPTFSSATTPFLAFVQPKATCPCVAAARV